MQGNVDVPDNMYMCWMEWEIPNTSAPPPISNGKHFQNYKIFPEKLKMVPM